MFWPIVGVVATLLILLMIWVSWKAHPLSDPVLAPPAQFKLIDGQVLKLDEMRGKVVLVDFWATSCAICTVELPGIARLGHDLADLGLVVVAVAMPYDRPDYVMDFARTSQLKLNIALDPKGDVTRQFAPIRGTPTLILNTRHGQIEERLEGPVSASALRARVHKLL